MHSQQSPEQLLQVQSTLLSSEPALVTGPLPLKRSWSLDDWDPQNPHYYHLTNLFNLAFSMTPGFLETALVHLLRRHDILRTRIHGQRGDWQMVVTDYLQPPLYWLDISHIAPTHQATLIERIAYELHTGIDPFAGPLLRVAYFERGNALPAQILFIIHHCITDATSQSILFQDFEAICLQLKEGQTSSLPAQTASFMAWSRWIASYAQEKLLKNLDWLSYYEALPWQRIKPVPVDEDTEVVAQSWADIFLDTKTVTALRRWQLSLKVHLIEILVAALARAFARWTGGSPLFLTLFDHGRSAVPDVDVSRTVGPFTLSRWCFLDLSGCQTPEAMLLKTKQQMRLAPNQGFDLEFACYYAEDPEVQQKIDVFLQTYQIQFNFLSTVLQDDQQPAEASEQTHILSPADGNVHEPNWETTSDEPYLPLYCMAALFTEGLKLAWRYDSKAYNQATMQTFTRYYRESLQAFAAPREKRVLR